MPALTLPLRYVPHRTPPDLPCEESAFHYRTLERDLPIAQTALVMVDCWDLHPIGSHERLTAQMMRERLKPVLDACRRLGMTVVHAPSPPQAKHYPQWTHFAGPDELGMTPPAPPPDWPPEAFRRREGEFAPFARPKEPRDEVWRTQFAERRRIADVLGPEPGDFVVATGEQLHRLLRHRQILHLLYAGFATNICVLYRDYGTRAMAARGYNVVLLRDCTLGIEMAETFADQTETRAAILSIETLTGFSTTGEALLAACETAG